MIRILAYTRAGREFETADALNELGALAISPRKVETIRLPKQRRPQVVESPFLSNYLFCAMDPDHWHEAKRDNIAFTICRDIGPHEWRNVQAFAQRIEADYQYRMEQIDAGDRLAEYTAGDALQILGGIMAGYMATFRRLHEGTIPMIEAVIEGGYRPVKIMLDPINARRLANT